MLLAFAESRSATPASMGCSSLWCERPRSAAEGHYRWTIRTLLLVYG